MSEVWWRTGEAARIRVRTAWDGTHRGTSVRFTSAGRGPSLTLACSGGVGIGVSVGQARRLVVDVPTPRLQYERGTQQGKRPTSQGDWRE